jgi:hypothetical protein
LTPETRTRRASVAAQRRLVAGLMACAAAVGGLVLLRGQGLSTAGATNWYLTAAAILVAVPAALIATLLYPLAIRALLPVWRRPGGLAGYVGVAGALERRMATALPGFTLVLALTLAAFGGMVNASIVGGQIAYSWRTTGADAVIDTNGAAYDITHERDTRLVLLMALPAVLAAFVAAAACALALPVLVSPALDLSVFTGPGASVSYRPDLAALGLPCGVILLLIAATLIAETSRSRRHGVTGLLRVQ